MGALYKAGTPVYETGEDVETALKNPASRLDYDLIGRIIKKEKGYLWLSCPGGASLWVKEEYAQYPPVE